jgi:hypothetical protein
MNWDPSREDKSYLGIANLDIKALPGVFTKQSGDAKHSCTSTRRKLGSRYPRIDVRITRNMHPCPHCFGIHTVRRPAGRPYLDPVGEDKDTDGARNTVIAMHEGIYRRLTKRREGYFLMSFTLEAHDLVPSA